MEPLVINNNSLSYKILNYLFKQSTILDVPPMGFGPGNSLRHYIKHNNINTTCDYRLLFVKLLFSMIMCIVTVSVLTICISIFLMMFGAAVIEFILCISNGLPFLMHAPAFSVLVIIGIPVLIFFTGQWLIMNKNKPKAINDLGDILSNKFCRKIQFDFERRIT